jgi:hypothetical protein
MPVYHHRIMRTTVDIPEHLLVEAKQLAAERHLPLTRLFEDSLRLYLGEQRLRRAQTGPAGSRLSGRGLGRLGRRGNFPAAK